MEKSCGFLINFAKGSGMHNGLFLLNAFIMRMLRRPIN